jgi:predicted SAM-dependent methyltransferase
MRINFGTGIIDGYESMDPFRFAHEPSIERDSVEAIYTSSVLQQMDLNDRKKFLERCWSVLIPGGTVHMVVPYYTAPQAYEDPDVKWPPFSERSFTWTDRSWRVGAGVVGYDMDFDVQFRTGGHEIDFLLTKKQSNSYFNS